MNKTINKNLDTKRSLSELKLIFPTPLYAAMIKPSVHDRWNGSQSQYSRMCTCRERSIECSPERQCLNDCTE